MNTKKKKKDSNVVDTARLKLMNKAAFLYLFVSEVEQ